MIDNIDLKPVIGSICTSLAKPEKANYDRKAKLYERLVGKSWFNRIVWNTLPKNYTRFAREALLEKTGSLIDIGCGGLSQTASLYLSTSNNCILFDRSIGMLKLAEERLIHGRKKIPPNVTLVQGDAFKLPFREESFDLLCSFGTLHLFDDKQGFIDSILRVLKPKGYFYLTVMTNKYLNSRLFMNFFKLFGEFGEVCTEKELLALFDSDKFIVDSYMSGSVLFIKGQKR